MTSEPSGQLARGAEIWIICGNACAGKTTTARSLAQQLPPAAHVEGNEMQRLIVAGCRWPVPGDSDPSTGRLTGEAGVQYALRIRNACLVAAATFAARVQAAADGPPSCRYRTCQTLAGATELFPVFLGSIRAVPHR